MNAKTCSICETRPAATGVRKTNAGMSSDMDYCVPCFEESGWENTHSDRAHETFEKLTVRGSSFKNKADLDAYKAEMREETKICWICNPEINEAKREYTVRQGTSRAGMVINVSIRAAGETKAAETTTQLQALVGEGETKAKVATAKKTGDVSLLLQTGKQEFLLFWDARGRFTGGSVKENGKVRKVRNVAEVLRIAS